MRGVLNILRRLAHGRDAVAAIEFALTAPVLIILLCGGTEMAFFLRAHFRAAQTAATVADVIARYDSLTAENIGALLSVSAEVMGDSAFDDNGAIILSSVSRSDGDDPLVAWQCTGGGAYEGASAIGESGDKASLPADLEMAEDDNVIVAEVYFDYPALFGWIPSSSTLIYKTALFRPRLGSLTTAPGCS